MAKPPKTRVPRVLCIAMALSAAPAGLHLACAEAQALRLASVENGLSFLV